MKRLDVIAAVLLVVGGLNWGIVGVGGPDLVASLLGAGSVASRLVYGLVGLSAVWQALQWRGIQRRWLAHPAGAVAVMALVTLFSAGTLQAQGAAHVVSVFRAGVNCLLKRVVPGTARKRQGREVRIGEPTQLYVGSARGITQDRHLDRIWLGE